MKKPQNLKIVHPQSEADEQSVISLNDFHVWYHDVHVLEAIDTVFHRQKINCIVGPSGGGKSTLIRSINRMNDEVEGFASRGSITVDGEVVTDPSVDVTRLRTKVGMVFQKPCVFPKSICENVLFGVPNAKKMSRQDRRQIVEDTLKAVSLWKEVAHRLNDKAFSLSIGQQQRLCIARTLAVDPKVILLDEPTSSLDPVATRAIEDLMLKFKEKYTIVFVTHNIQQARRIADRLIFMCDGKIIEQGSKQKLFSHPEKPQTRAYLNDEYCDC